MILISNPHEPATLGTRDRDAAKGHLNDHGTRPGTPRTGRLPAIAHPVHPRNGFYLFQVAR